MHIEHIAIWTNNLEQLREFYEKYFQAKSGSLYRNPAKQFESYFMTFSSGTRLEILSRPGLPGVNHMTGDPSTGYIHIAIACGNKEGVDALTDCLRNDGYHVVDGPRHTGDGYYESVVLDPDGNQVEITV